MLAAAAVVAAIATVTATVIATVTATVNAIISTDIAVAFIKNSYFSFTKPCFYDYMISHNQ